MLSQVVSDLVDEDFVMNRRPQPVSALLFGAASLLGRPGQSFAPIVGFALLSSLIDGRGNDSEVIKTTNDQRAACFTLAWSTVTVVGLAQLVIWSRYRLHGVYLIRIKKERLTINGQRCLAPPSTDTTHFFSRVIGV